MKDYSFIKLASENLSDDLNAHFSHFEKLMDVLFSLFWEKSEAKNISYKNERLYYLNLLAQKFMLHGFSVKKLVSGITLDSPSKKIKVPIMDPFSIYSLSRSMIETYLVQNYLSNISCDADLLEGRFEIWMRFGLSKRGDSFDSDEAKKVFDLDKKSIEQLDGSIKQRQFYSNLSEEKRIKFLQAAKTEWKFMFDNDKFFPVSWKKLLEEAGIISVICENTYNFLSWHAHSQSISILQLSEMWDMNREESAVRISIKQLNMFIAFLISDIVNAEPNFRKAFNNLNADLQEIVNFYSVPYRDQQFSIKN